MSTDRRKLPTSAHARSAHARRVTQPRVAEMSAAHRAAQAVQQHARLTPYALTPDDVLALQRTVGNAAVNHMLAEQNPPREQLALQARRALDWGGLFSAGPAGHAPVQRAPDTGATPIPVGTSAVPTSHLQRTPTTQATGQQPVLQRAFDPATVAMLEKHMGAKARQQVLIAQDKQGQGMAEERARSGRADISSSTADPTATQREEISAALRRLVEFTKYDDLSSVSVLVDAAQGGLSNADKWDIITVNSDFMRYIEDGMTINKIIPDSSVRSILDNGQMSQFGNSVGGSVAHEKNYGQGLTGAQAVSNFGLDYGGYTDVVGGKQVNLEKGKEVAQYGDWGGHSSYIKRTGLDRSGRNTMAAVPNVFYVTVQLQGTDIAKVKVPIHDNIITFAASTKADILATLQDGTALSALAANLGGSEQEVNAVLKKKLAILDRFLSVALFSSTMAVSTKLSGAKNEEDPLTNLGMTKPGSRLQNKFGTINQEYHLQGFVNLPEQSGLWLKDQTGKDKVVGRLVKKDGVMAWSALKVGLIRAALIENEHFRRS